MRSGYYVGSNKNYSRASSSFVLHFISPSFSSLPGSIAADGHSAVYHKRLPTSTQLLARGDKKKGKGDKTEKVRFAKGNFPSKTCVACGRPFEWRKKWQRRGDEVTTCSKACDAQRRAGNHVTEDYFVMIDYHKISYSVALRFLKSMKDMGMVIIM
jgi:hypothetical protein